MKAFKRKSAARGSGRLTLYRAVVHGPYLHETGDGYQSGSQEEGGKEAADDEAPSDADNFGDVIDEIVHSCTPTSAHHSARPDTLAIFFE
jgi:hypothetical protein